MKKYIYLISVLFTLSCTTEIPFPKYEGENKLVIGCLFTIDSVFSVHVHHTQAIFDTSENYVNNANVELWSNGYFIEKLQQVGNGHYKSITEKAVSFKPYTLKVSANGFSSIEATDSIPQKQTILSKEINYLVGFDNERGDYYSTIDFSFTNNASKNCYFENYINSIGYGYMGGHYNDDGVWVYTDSVFVSEILTYIDSDNVSIQVKEDFFFSGTINLVYSNELMPSEKETIKLKFFKGGFSYLVLYHNSLSENTYKYKLSLKKHLLGQGKYEPNTITEIATLFSRNEAAEVFTNIKNGYGIFGGYAVDTAMIKVKEGAFDTY